MSPSHPVVRNGSPLSLKWALLSAIGAVAAFHIAFTDPQFSFMIVPFLACLMVLAEWGTYRKTFYGALAIGCALYAPKLGFFWTIFGPTAVALWLVLAFWIALFVIIVKAVRSRWHPIAAALVIPFLWTGLEYFRSELYYLRFSWLALGYAVHDSPAQPLARMLGVYGIGFAGAALASALVLMKGKTRLITLGGATAALGLALTLGPASGRQDTSLHVAGIQAEFAAENEVLPLLNKALAQAPDTDVFAMGEYSFDGPVPPRVKEWCRTHKRYLVAGGKQEIADKQFFNMAFVIGPDGEVVHEQAKSVPIQFFQDGLPAPRQTVWESPWGKIGIGICYDLSYTRVMDRLVRQGAQAIIIPTMDILEWGEHQHVLHSWIAPVRAAEYGIPILRPASSGISQIVDAHGRVLCSAPFGGQGDIVSSSIQLGPGGCLPLDRWLAPFSAGLTIAATAALLIGAALRRKGLMPRNRSIQPSTPRSVLK